MVEGRKRPELHVSGVVALRKRRGIDGLGELGDGLIKQLGHGALGLAELPGDRANGELLLVVQAEDCLVLGVEVLQCLLELGAEFGFENDGVRGRAGVGWSSGSIVVGKKALCSNGGIERGDH